MIKQETIEAIIDAARIEEVIGDFVTLRRRGQNMIGLCPFHNEKTPSFSVSPSRGIYKCFGCGKSGNVVGFIMEHEHQSYPEALRYLAGKYGVAVEEEAQTDEEKEIRNKRDSLLHIHNFALEFFRKSLFEDEEGRAIGLSYLKEREFREDILKKFELGYSPESWDALTARAMNEGFSSDYLIESGLTIKKEQRLYDRFRGRIIFPIHNLTGSPLAFAGRILSNEKNRPKYVNSPETEIYHKSKVLYGLFQSRQAIVLFDECLLVEGYTDVLSLHQAGIENVVSSSGTSLSVDQIRLIHRYTENITILYDGDDAGLKASFRGIDMILEQGLNVRLVLFPEGEDPDSYVRKNRVNVVRDFIRSRAENFILFKARLLKKEAGKDPILKAAGIKDIVSSIAIVPDAIKRNLFIRECSEMMDMPEQTLMFEMNKMLRKKLHDRSPEPIQDTEDTAPALHLIEKQVEDKSLIEKELIRILLNYGELEFNLLITADGLIEKIPVNTASYILNQIITNHLDLEDEACNLIANLYKKSLEKEELPSINLFLNNSNEIIASLAIDLVSNQHHLSANWGRRKITVQTEADKLDELVMICINRFKLNHLNEKLKEISEGLKVEEEEEFIFARLLEHRDLQKKKVEVARLLGQSIMY